MSLGPEPQTTGFDALLPPAMAERAEEVGAAKARQPVPTLLVLAILAGAFIALGSGFFTTVTTASELGYGTGRLVGGLAFSLGLILVVVAGAELFTGNNLMVMAWAGGRIQTLRLLMVWGVVYVGNFVGAFATAALVALSGQWRFAEHEVGANAVRIAQSKVSLDLEEAFFLGIVCNALVCLAVWLTYSSRSNIDRAVVIVFPITAFVASGYEHSIANMYFIPLGLLLKSNDAVSAASGLEPEALEVLTVDAFLLDNLLPVTAGNIVGGALLVGAVYWFVYRRALRA